MIHADNIEDITFISTTVGTLFHKKNVNVDFDSCHLKLSVAIT